MIPKERLERVMKEASLDIRSLLPAAATKSETHAFLVLEADEGATAKPHVALAPLAGVFDLMRGQDLGALKVALLGPKPVGAVRLLVCSRGAFSVSYVSATPSLRGD